MNYLAHAYLSFGSPEILAGNMVSDFIKGKGKFTYPAGVQRGIQLHRAIDDFTDFHPVTREAKEIFRPCYRLYSGAFIDIVYDHFLANDKEQFLSEQHLHDFTLATYATLETFEPILPLDFRRMLPFMISHNWLYNYRKEEGMMKSFQGLVRRARYLHESEVAFQLFLEHYDRLGDCYRRFFPSLKEFVQLQIPSLQ